MNKLDRHLLYGCKPVQQPDKFVLKNHIDNKMIWISKNSLIFYNSC